MLKAPLDNVVVFFVLDHVTALEGIAVAGFFLASHKKVDVTNRVNSITLRIILIIKRLELSLKVKISWHNCSNKKGLCFVIYLHLINLKKSCKSCV